MFSGLKIITTNKPNLMQQISMVLTEVQMQPHSNIHVKRRKEDEAFSFPFVKK